MSGTAPRWFPERANAPGRRAPPGCASSICRVFCWSPSHLPCLSVVARLPPRGQEHKLYALFADRILRECNPMKRLFLLRHSKAVPTDSGTEDFDRTLMLSGMQD